MKFLSPADYLQWPSFAQRICYAYNSIIPHESNANVSPLEMDFRTPPVSPFAPPTPHDDPDPHADDAHDDSQQLLTPPTTLSPALAAAAIRVSVAAFHRYAHAHATYMQQTTEERLNKQGNPTTFQLRNRVKIYICPTHACPIAPQRSQGQTRRGMARPVHHHPRFLAWHLRNDRGMFKPHFPAHSRNRKHPFLPRDPQSTPATPRHALGLSS
jgi:hypothetical protein